MDAASSPATNRSLFTPPGRIASIIIRYHDYQEFIGTARLLHELIGNGDDSSLPPDENPTGKKQVYRTPVGKGAAMLELRLVCHDLSSAKQADTRRKQRISTYYQVGTQAYSTPAEANKALMDAAVAVHQQNLNLNILGSIEQDEDIPFVRAGTQRVILADNNGDNQVCLLVNPPFPLGTPGPPPAPTRLIAVVVTLLGLGALLFGGRQLMRQPAAAPLP